MAGEAPKVFTIPAGAPFLPVLADAVLAGRLVDLDAGDPLALARLTILLPTRRAMRALRDIFIERLGGRAAILPMIRPIGDVDEEDELLAPAAESPSERLALPQAISRLDRQLALSRLTLAWGRSLRRAKLALDPREPLLIPASAADAFRLSGDLARLIDDMHTHRKAPELIDGLAPEDHTRYFQITLDFLKIAFAAWPDHLAGIGRVDPADRRDRLIRTAAERLEADHDGAPVIAAGSTGSIPATAELLRVIACRGNGALVLPGLDTDLDEAGWRAIGDQDAPPPAHGHPQFGLKQLLKTVGIERREVVRLGEPPAGSAARARIVSEALRPAETTDLWALHRTAADVAAAIEGTSLIVARNEQEEALAIAVALREALEMPGATAALVTPDRTLARRVTVELQRWGAAFDDSAGTPLARLPAGVFARLVADAALAEGDPVALLAVLKHPLAAFGMARPECRRAARSLEIAVFRGRRVTGGVGALGPALARARREVEERTVRHLPAARRRLTRDEWALAERLVAALERVVLPLEQALGRAGEVSTAEAVALLADALGEAARDEAGRDDRLRQGADGLALVRLLDGLAAGEAEALAMQGGEFPDFLTAVMGEIAVNRPPGIDPRIEIWGTLEARLQSADLVILGGLDEGVWPADTRTDPWLSRAMRSEIGLPPPERRIGQAAHDFAVAFAGPRVLVTRAEKRGGTPTVRSRWLQRIAALIGPAADKDWQARGARYLALARRLDDVPLAAVRRAARPAPRPPVADRPRSLSITEIETWVRDPYAIYARHVLRLDPLDPLGLAPDFALRGTLMHEALGRFIGDWRKPFDAAAEAALLALSETIFAPLAEFPDIHALWCRRFAGVARWFIGFEAAREAAIAGRHAELSGSLEIAAPGGPFKLRGRADRIDIRRDDAVEILDFKSGTPPSAPQVLTGFAPQLALEAAMVREGAFNLPDGSARFDGRTIAEIAWLALNKAERGSDPFKSAVKQDMTVEATVDRVFAEFRRLVEAFDDPERPYVSLARPMFIKRWEGPYDHLARIREWSEAEPDGDEE